VARFTIFAHTLLILDTYYLYNPSLVLSLRSQVTFLSVDLAEQPSSSESVEPRLPVLLLIAVTASWLIAQLGYYSQTQLFGPLMTSFGLGEGAIGMMMSQELAAFGISAFAMAGPLSKISRVKVAMAGGFLVIVGNLVSGYTDSFETLRFARICAGFGGGMITAAGTAAAASSINPQRVFSIVMVTWGLVASSQRVLIPYFTEPYGASGGFFFMAAAAALLLPLCIWLLPPTNSETAQASSSRVDPSLSLISRITERLGLRDAPNRRFALWLMPAIFIFAAGQAAVELFLEQFGLRSGLDVKEIGEVLAVVGIGSLVGGAFAAWLGLRYGTIGPIVVGISLNVVAAFGLCWSEDPVDFVSFNLLWGVSYLFVVPYIYSALSDMDDKGRWVVAVDALWYMGDSPGPAVGGYVVESVGYQGLSLLPVFTGVLCLVLMVATLRQFYRSSQAATAGR
jgi:predicted MFS family arabinose efflux permease